MTSDGAGVMRLVTAGAPGARDDLAARLATLEAAARRVRHGADAEAVHDLRVATRRLGAALALWAPALARGAAERARRRAGRLRRRLRALRDLEVARAAVLERVAHVTPADRDVLVAFAARLGRRLERQAGQVRTRVTRRRIARIRRAVERAIERGSAPADAAGCTAMARAHVAAERQRAASALAAAAAAPRPARWHRARIALKHWRYAVECATPLLGADATEAIPLATLRTLQAALGEVQDLVVLRRLARDRARALARRGHEAGAAALERFADALRVERHAAMERAYRLATTLSAGAAAV